MAEEKRKPGGRERPYTELRIMAKVYAVLAPLGGAVVLFAAIMTMVTQELPFFIQLPGIILAVVLALVYYIILRASSQFIYILFDIAGTARRVRELVERPGGTP